MDNGTVTSPVGTVCNVTVKVELGPCSATLEICEALMTIPSDGLDMQSRRPGSAEHGPVARRAQDERNIDGC